MIPRLEDLPVGHRVIITFCIVLVVLFALALIGYLTGGWDQAEGAAPAVEPEITKFESDVLALDREAMDKAFIAHLQLLFTTWMKDYGTEGVEGRVIRGAQNGRRAYIKAREALEQREKKMEERK
jgi:hypothetical protein